MPYYIEINSDGIGFAFSDLNETVNAPTLIPVADASVPLGMLWTGSGWEDVPRDPVPAAIDQAALIDLCQSVGGMTDAMLVAAHSDPALAALWIKFGAASQFLPDDTRVISGLAAFASLGYLPGGAQAVIDGWPT